MAIYKRKDLSNLKEWSFKLDASDLEFEGSNILKESPNFELKDNDNITKLHYRLKCDKDPQHGPRLKALESNPNLNGEINMHVNNDGSITLEKNEIGKNSIAIARRYAIIAGGFAKFAVKEIYDAYYKDNYDRSRMNKKIKEYNSLNKQERKRYMQSAKSSLKIGVK